MSTSGVIPLQIAEALRPKVYQGYESLLLACQQTNARVSGTVAFDLYPQFLFSAFLVFQPDREQDELALGVNVTREGLIVNISSDLCLETGQIVLDGPSSSVDYEKLLRDPSAALEDWIEEFQRFLPHCKAPILHFWSDLKREKGPGSK